MKMLLIILLLLLMLSGCVKSDVSTTEGGISNSTEATLLESENMSDKEFLAEYYKILDYLYVKFQEEHFSFFLSSITEYLDDPEAAIEKCKQSRDQVQVLLDELESLRINSGFGLKEPHEKLVETMSLFVSVQNDIIVDMEDGCNSGVIQSYLEKSNNILFLIYDSLYEPLNITNIALNDHKVEKPSEYSENKSQNEGIESKEDEPSSSIFSDVTNNEEYEIIYFTNEELEFDGSVWMARSIFDEYINTEMHSENYVYSIEGKCSIDDIDYIVVIGGTPEKMAEYYLVDLYNNRTEDKSNNYVYVEPLIYSAGWYGIQPESIDIVFKHEKLLLP